MIATVVRVLFLLVAVAATSFAFLELGNDWRAWLVLLWFATATVYVFWVAGSRYFEEMIR